jgi:hypothetical protein
VLTLSGPSHVEALAFEPDGTLYASGAPSGGVSDELYTVDLGTGALSHIGHIGTTDVDQLAMGPSGMLFGIDAQAGTIIDLWSIDPASGAGVNLGSTGVLEINGIAAVPEPGTITLLTLGTIALLRRERNRT